ncbi:MAG: Uma2 family endonuclease [Gemmataceae bacterium]
MSPTLTEPTGRAYSPETMADVLRRLGDIPPGRVRSDPPPGTATLTDLIRVNERGPGPTCEWVDGTLVEKTLGQHESWVGIVISHMLMTYLDAHDLGMVYGEAAVLRILPGIGRAPDVAFVSWVSLPGGKPPPRADKVPAVVPALAVEVLSESNTKAEMARKRDEYFRAGVTLVWEIDPASRSAVAYTAADRAAPVPVDGTLDGGPVLPGFTLSLKAVFDRADRMSGGPQV